MKQHGDSCYMITVTCFSAGQSSHQSLVINAWLNSEQHTSMYSYVFYFALLLFLPYHSMK